MAIFSRALARRAGGGLTPADSAAARSAWHWAPVDGNRGVPYVTASPNRLAAPTVVVQRTPAAVDCRQ